MFGGMGDAFKNMQMLAKLSKDENFRKLMEHPKIQALMTDPEFRGAAKSKNMLKLMSNPEFTKVFQDPEIVTLIQELNKKS